MARRTANAEPEETTEEITLTPIQEENEAIEQNIMAAFDADPDSIVWDCKVYKLDRTAGNAEDYLFSVLPSELDGLLDRLRDSEGTGTYRVRVYRKEGNKNRVFKQFDRRVKAPTKVTPPAPPQSDISAILAAMERNNNRVIEVVTAALNRQPQYAPAPVAPANPFEMMTQMATAMGTLMGALRPAEGATSTDLIMKGVELANKLGGSDKETNFLDVVRDALQSLPALVEMSKAQGATALPPTGTPIKPRPTALPVVTPQPQAPAPQVTPHPIPTDANQVQAQLRDTILYLIPKAAKSSEPGLYAEWLADNWGMDIAAAVLGQPNILPQLQMLVPEMTPYAAWFQSLLAELTELVNDARAAASGSDNNAPGKPHTAVSPLRDTGWTGGGEGDVEAYE